jgi:N-acetylglucosamine-6-phosphate deacetylase
MVRAKTVERSILVSDSVALAGSPPGQYQTPVGGHVELSADRRLSVAGTDGDLLAGSVSCLTECVAWAAGTGGLGVADAFRMAAINPRQLLATSAQRERRAGMEPGGLRVGDPADLSQFSVDESGGLRLDAAMLGGQIIMKEGGVQ